MARPMAAPLHIRWNYTYACNFNCSHCYTRADWYPNELSSAQYEQIADQIIAAGVFCVGLGGGESLLRRDCLATLARLRAGDIYTVLTTNGWMVDERMAGRLAAVGLGRLQVSLDSPTPAEHDAFRNRSGSHARVVRALRASVAAGLRVYLSTVITAQNLDRLGDVVALAEREDLRGITFIPFRPAGNGLRTKARYQPHGEQNARLAAEVARLRRHSDLDLLFAFSDEETGPATGCGCGVRHLTIRPNGDVSPCNFAEAVVGNLTREPLTRIWRSSPALQAWRDQGGCTPSLDQPAPANPYLRASTEAVLVAEGAPR